MRRRKLKLFFKSFIVTSIILGTILALLLGFLKGHSIMQSEKTGKTVKIIEITKDAVLILGKEIYERK
jgi:hypothetical protein